MVSHDMQAVLFDLDGTLLDTHDLLLATFRYTARTVLREAIPDERLMAKVGQPLNTQMWRSCAVCTGNTTPRCMMT